MAERDYIGIHVKQFESGNKNSLCIAQCGNDWGGSYGTYQMILRFGVVIKFLQRYFPSLAKNLYFNSNMPDIATPKYPGSQYCSSPDAVKTVWLTCYNAVGEKAFGFFEHEYIKENFYDVGVNYIKTKIGIDINKTNRAYQECLWAGCVRVGANYFCERYMIPMLTTYPDVASVLKGIYNKMYADLKENRYTDGYGTEYAVVKKLMTQKPFDSNLVRISIDDLNIREQANVQAKSLGYVPRGVYTIVDIQPGAVSNTQFSLWGLLKSYATNRNGWICLDYVSYVD